MEIRQAIQAGTKQSSDLMVFIEPAQGLEIIIESTVKKQFEHLILEQVEACLDKYEIKSGRIRVSDRGALDYAIAARLETGIKRACA
jgi:citrate lyase subunit gamma (acyl carrier protein)